jgi:hypothetical protein
VHEPEYIVVDVTEELNLRLNTPVIADILKSRMPIKHSTIPPAHLAVRYNIGVLDFAFLQDLSGLME